MLTAFSICLIAAAISSPADEMRAAADDVQRLPPETRSAVRYLTVYPLPAANRPDAVKVISYVLNSVSQTRAVSQPELISPTLIRFSISQYAPRQDEFAAWYQAWEKLAEADPYFHLRTEVIAEATDTNHKSTAVTASFSDEHSKSNSLKIVTTDGGWADLSAAAQLHAATHSIGPLLRADYFIAQATTTPRYYEFTGIPDTENEFLKSLGVDRSAIDHLRECWRKFGR